MFYTHIFAILIYIERVRVALPKNLNLYIYMYNRIKI